MKIIFIVQTFYQPRIHKRIETFLKNGYSVKVYSFDRGWYSVNKPDFEVEHVILSRCEDANYLKRLFLLFKTLLPIYRSYKNKDVIYYSMGLDNTLFTALFSRKEFIYEISDLMYIDFKFVFERILKIIDKILIRRSVFTVLTSNGFLKYFFNVFEVNEIERPYSDKIFIAPNKVNKGLSTFERKITRLPNINKLNFAFVGLLRYADTILPFIKSLKKSGKDHEFHFYGDGALKSEIEEWMKEFDNIHFHGPFKNPADLPSIYDNIDLNFVCYDTLNRNALLAEPNKYYESIFFCTPLIVSKGTFLSENVDRNNVGFIIDPKDDKDLDFFLETLTVESIIEKSNKQKLIPVDELINDDNKLIEFLNFKGISPNN